MSTAFRIQRVALVGIEPPHSWSFPDRVTVIVGDSGGGKTTLLNLINFALGAKVQIPDVVTEAARAVSLDARLGGAELTLTREFRRNQIHVVRDSEEVGNFSTQSGQSRPWISKFLLDLLEIPSIRVPKSRTGSSHQLSSLSFQDLFAYCFLDQDQVDRSTVFSEDKFREPKRRWAFELLHGIVNEESARVLAEREETAEARSNREATLETVEDFLIEHKIDTNAVTSLADYQTQLNELIATRNSLERDLSSLDDDQKLAEETIEHTELRYREQVVQRDALRTDALSLQTELDGLTRVANQLERDLDSLSESVTSRAALDQFPFVNCPRCDQELSNRSVSVRQCVVCLQPEPTFDPRTTERARTSLLEQLAETAQLKAQTEIDLEVLEKRLGPMDERLSLLRQEVESGFESEIRPIITRRTELVSLIETTTRSIVALEEAKTISEVVGKEKSVLTTETDRIKDLDIATEMHDIEMRPLLLDRIKVLSESFDEILHDFQLPWLDHAYVDESTYLPMVNGKTLSQLSSGGMKATTNVAYYLSIFATALIDKTILTPGFLMLDSIRKDHGSGDEDLASAERIYRYLRTWQAMSKSAKFSVGDFQILIVDNDLPAEFKNDFNVLEINPSRPLIRQ